MESGFNGDPAFNWSSTNPFLEDVLAMVNGSVDDDDSRSTISTYCPSGVVVQPFERIKESQPPRSFKLPEYWPHAPDLWFCRAEFRFEVVGIVAEREKFAHVAEALNYDSLKMVKDLMVSLPLFQPYQALKARLLLATQLTPIQMTEKLMKAGDLGDRRPSQLLASLLEFCPPGEENTSLFRASYLMRLPSEIRSHLDGCEDGDLKELAAKADRHWCNRTAASAAAVAVVKEEPDEDVVAAVGFKQQHFKKGSKLGSQGGGQSGGHNKKAEDGGLKKVAYCWKHQRFGKFANSCADRDNCEFKKAGN